MPRLEGLRSRVTKEHMDVYKSVEHILRALDEAAMEHEKMAMMQAIEGNLRMNAEVKTEEKTFRETMILARKLILDNFEKTLQDFETKGVKGATKNFKDGVE